MIDEEESKRLRIFQREKRLELQLIIKRCNEVDFEYVCKPNIRRENELCFGTKTSRKIQLFDDKKVNSYMRKCLKELFPETQFIENSQKDNEGIKENQEIRLSYPFSSKVPRFTTDVMDSTGFYRQKKRNKESQIEKKKLSIAFGTTKDRKFLITREKIILEFPGPGVYNVEKSPIILFSETFGGRRVMKEAFKIVCLPKFIDTKCDLCEEELRNVYWKNEKTQSIFCRSCYNQKLLEIQTKTRGVVDKFRKVKEMKENYKKFCPCDFYHEHNNSTAAIRLLSPKQFHNRIKDESVLSTKFYY